MSSFMGHSLGAAACWKLLEPWATEARRPERTPLVAAVVLGALPDLDVVAAIALKPFVHLQHRGPSHSLLAAVGLGLITGWIVTRLAPENKATRLLPAFFIVACIHPLLDWAMACGPPVPFLWPLTGKGWLSPVQFVPTAYYSHSLAGLLGLFTDPRSVVGALLEISVLGSMIVAFARRRVVGDRWLWRWDRWSLCFAVLAALGELAIFVRYN